MTMPIDRIPDWEMRLKRMDAWWERQVLDRPVVRIMVPKHNPDYPMPAKQYASHRERWLDPQFCADWWRSWVMNNEYLGDALPTTFPNLGPDVFSAFLGAELEFADGTSWSKPILEHYADADRIRLSRDNLYWKKMVEMTDALLEAGRGMFYTGITDLHVGGDAIASLRDPTRLNLDLLLDREAVKAFLARINGMFFKVFDFFYEKLRRAGQPLCTWAPGVSSRKWGVPSNDFSCMISKEMFDDVFLPGIRLECRHMEANLYHLDGPGALKHLDSLLQIEELNAIQWVSGAGHGRASDWLPVYRKIQAAGKGIQLDIEPDELDFFMEYLRPEGLNIGIYGVENVEQGEGLIKKISRWR